MTSIDGFYNPAMLQRSAALLAALTIAAQQPAVAVIRFL